MTPDDPRHGTLRGVSAHRRDDETPCAECRKAKADYWRNLQRQRAYGRWNPWVDAEPAREHVRALMAAGMPLAAVAEAAGTQKQRVSHLVYGRGRKAPPAKIRPEYADAILSVALRPTRLSPLGVARRLQALVALGHATTVLADHLGISKKRLDQLLTGNRGDRVMRSTYDKVAALYDRLSMQLPDQSDTLGKYRASRSRNTAERHGWVPPLAWDDIDTDPTPSLRSPRHTPKTDVDEAVVLRVMAGERLPMTTAERTEVVARLRARGWSLNEIEMHTRIGKPERYIGEAVA